MDDLISRQAAITQLSHNKNKGDDEWELAVENDIQTIWKLPPTQLEIIKCKDCKHHRTHKCMDSMPIERCDLEQTFYDAEHDFCSLAERRTDVWEEVKK